MVAAQSAVWEMLFPLLAVVFSFCHREKHQFQNRLFCHSWNQKGSVIHLENVEIKIHTICYHPNTNFSQIWPNN